MIAVKSASWCIFSILYLIISFFLPGEERKNRLQQQSSSSQQQEYIITYDKYHTHEFHLSCGYTRQEEAHCSYTPYTAVRVVYWYDSISVRTGIFFYPGTAAVCVAAVSRCSILYTRLLCCLPVRCCNKLCIYIVGLLCKFVCARCWCWPTLSRSRGRCNGRVAVQV